MTGLQVPSDLEQWHRWQNRQLPLPTRLRHTMARLARPVRSGSQADRATLTVGGPRPRVVVALETRATTSRLALLEPLAHLEPSEVAVLADGDVADLLPPAEWTTTSGDLGPLVRSVLRDDTVVLSTGHYLRFGAAARAHCDPHRFLTVQHGLLTPQAPPLAPSTHLLAWSSADADFWPSGRGDVSSTVVGSQLLWRAAERPADPAQGAPVFLGQLHGAELPFDVMADSALAFCRATGATYRPHPGERNRRSRAAHARFVEAGVALDRSGLPLTGLGRPVVSAFSTGVLEAAAQGIPSWVHQDRAPEWLREFWARYGLAQWGGPPTPAPARPSLEPALAIATFVRTLLEKS